VRLFARQGGRPKITAGAAEYRAEDDFATDNAAGPKVRRLNAQAFCYKL
jgi:hypothetical protein